MHPVCETHATSPEFCFNAGLAVLPGQDRYVLVYRPSETAFRLCMLDREFSIASESIDLGLQHCTDPRLIWLPDGQLLLVYSSCESERGFPTECIRGALLSTENQPRVMETFRISPLGLPRQKNWMPFVHDNLVFLIAAAKPHTIYEWPNFQEPARLAHETDWISPWFSSTFFRGNANAVLLEDGNYLATYHSVQPSGLMNYYDNGCYVFEGRPPFRVLRAAHRTYLPAEAATEPHFRKAGIITVCFPCGLVLEQERLIVSYGDNDSSQFRNLHGGDTYSPLPPGVAGGRGRTDRREGRPHPPPWGGVGVCYDEKLQHLPANMRDRAQVALSFLSTQAC